MSPQKNTYEPTTYASVTFSVIRVLIVHTNEMKGTEYRFTRTQQKSGIYSDQKTVKKAVVVFTKNE
jgi:hypothetical protein